VPLDASAPLSDVPFDVPPVETEELAELSSSCPLASEHAEPKRVDRKRSDPAPRFDDERRNGMVGGYVVSHRTTG
jgi:hypothetical protein